MRDSITLLNKPFPLPPGQWIPLASGYGRVEGLSPGAYGAIASVLLVQVRDHTVVALALLQTNVSAVENGWGVPKACSSAAFASTGRMSARNVTCSFADVVLLNSPELQRLPVWQEGIAEARRRGLTIPNVIAVAGARVGDRQDVLDARYAFDPNAFGLTSKLPVAVTAESALAFWTRDMEQRLEAALVNTGLPVKPLPAPSLAIADPQTDEMPLWKLSLYKLGTNRVLQTAISFGIGLMITANVATSTSLAVLQSLTHSLVYYGNELIWEWPTSPPEMDFVAENRP